MAKALETGIIYRDDNLPRLREIEAESVDLIYLDPPFFSDRHYEIIWGDESEIRSFEDRWKGGIGHYIDWMKPRLEEMKRVLKPTGSIYLHCDPHASHYLKIAMDRIFGVENFRNEVIWHYYNKMHDRRKKMFPRATDTILFYVKDVQSPFTFNQLRETREKPVKQLLREKVNGKMVNKKDEHGRVQYKISHDKLMDNVWRLPALQPAAREKLGYPTQKPEALLKRVIEASSNRGDIVLDPFCGCGTAVAVAHKMQRQWIGIDISYAAVDIIVERMSKIGAVAVVKGGLESVSDLRNLEPIEFQNFVLKRVNGAANPNADMGIDGFSFMEELPIEIKRQDRVGREVVDKFETATKRHGAHKGYIIAFSFTKGAYEEVARIRPEGLEIALVELKTLFEVRHEIDTRPAASRLEEDLFRAVRYAAANPSQTPAVPRRTLAELAASAPGPLG